MTDDVSVAMARKRVETRSAKRQAEKDRKWREGFSKPKIKDSLPNHKLTERWEDE